MNTLTAQEFIFQLDGSRLTVEVRLSTGKLLTTWMSLRPEDIQSPIRLIGCCQRLANTLIRERGSNLENPQ